MKLALKKRAQFTHPRKGSICWRDVCVFLVKELDSIDEGTNHGSRIRKGRKLSITMTNEHN
jgi:hypothetical protein